MLRLRLEYDDLCLIRLSWQWMTERCRGRIWVICLSPARYSAIRWTHQTLVRAAISFVEKKVVLLYGSTLLAKGHGHARHDCGPDSQIHPLSSASLASVVRRRQRPYTH